MKDRALLELAEAEGRLVLTLDKDFWHIARQRPSALKRSGVVLFRMHPATPRNIEPLLALMLQGEHTWTGHISVITAHGVEMFPTTRDP